MNRDLAPSGSWSNDLSNTETVEPTLSASSSSLGHLYEHQGRPMPTAEGKGYHKHACRSTAQYFVVRDSSSTPLSPISVSEISSHPHSDLQLSTVQHYSMHDSSSTPLSPISVLEISSCPHSDSQLSTAQHFVAHDLSSAPLSPISVLEIAWCLQSDSPLSPLASLSSSPVVTYPPLPA